MSRDEGPPPDDAVDELLAGLLAAYDERLAAGCSPEAETQAPDGLGAGCLGRLRVAEKVLARLERAWPRTSATQATKNTLAADEAVPQVPGYEILGELGRGGMGVVYKARQKGLDRVVALKMILAGGHAGRQERARFRSEAKSVARLQHPNIVQVHEVGEHDGLPYFSLEYCPGGSLAEKLRGEPLPAQEAARLVELLARAVAVAHQADLVHRDLKPANILLAANGTAKITDFGLAKRLDEAGQTRSGSVLGTPSYMAPEQAAGQTGKIGPAVDVYALGAILYELLTGRPPFKAATPVGTIRQVLDQEAVSVRRLQPQTHVDLATICHKCLEKDPARRYATALALAEDLRRFQAGEPIEGRPVGRGERALKWVRRRPWMAAAYGLLALVLVLGGLGGGAAWLWRQADVARDQAVEAWRQAEAGRAREAELRQRLAEVSYLHQVGLAYREWQDGEMSRVEQLLQSCPAELRHWEWHYVHKLCHPEPLFTLRGHTGPLHHLAHHRDGRRLVTWGTDGTVREWDARTGKLLSSRQGPKLDVVRAIITPDGQYVAWLAKDQSVKVWDVAAAKEIVSSSGPFAKETHLFVSPNGRRLAAADCERGPVYIWDIPSGREVTRLPWVAHAGPGVAAFSPDSRYFAASCQDDSIRWCDLATGKQLPPWQEVPPETSAIAFSPDGKLLAGSAVDHSVRLWDAATGQLRLTLWRSTSAPNKPSFSPDGGSVAFLYDDQTVKACDTTTGKELLRLRLPPGVNFTYTPDGPRLVRTADDGTVTFWDALAVPAGVSVDPQAGWVQALAFSPDNTRLAGAHDDGTVRVRDAATGKEVLRIKAYQGRTTGVAYAPDGRHLASASRRKHGTGWTGEVKVWDARTGASIRTLAGSPSAPYRVAWSPDGRLLACAGLDDKIQVWDATTGRCVITCPEGVCVTFSPDSRRVIGGTRRGEVKVRDAATGAELLTLKGHAEQVVDVACSRDGRWIASASYDSTVNVWDATTGSLKATFPGHNERALGVAFSPDGRRVASSSDDRTLRLFVTDKGEEALILRGHMGPVHCVAFSPDGRRIASGGWDQTVRLWDAGAPSAGGD
jgi:WD40 repeat protein